MGWQKNKIFGKQYSRVPVDARGNYKYMIFKK